TPVIAFNRGSMPELILHSKTGFIVKSIDEAVVAVQDVNLLIRRDCYEWAVSKFTIQKMIEGYLKVYREILSI
ncbi:MAG: glycosyltransferase family 4 protein, partial [Cyclobacteriaceae bacterium]|nr:glycosyltransferase family 4 protein [Cyclobacteriaceae bacterium]